MSVNVMVQEHVRVYIGYYDNGINPYVFAYWMIPWEKTQMPVINNHMCLHVGEAMITTCVCMLVMANI